MATRGVRKKEGEDLSDTTIDRVISLLSGDAPITKKEACEILNISYNTTRLNKIISEYTDRKNFALEKRKELKHKPVSVEDEKYIVEEYLENPVISAIADSTFRSPAVIKMVLQKYNIPLRDASVSYMKPLFLEDNSAKENYEIADLVYSARYASPALISKLLRVDKVLGSIYRIWVYKDMQYAYQPWYELADLTDVQNKLGIKISDMPKEEVIQLINEALTKARKDKNRE